MYRTLISRTAAGSVTLNARMQNGLRVQGGLGTGRQLLNDCDFVEAVPEMLHTFFGNPNRFFAFAARPLERCEENNGWRTSLQGLAAYTIPKVDVAVSVTWQSLPGVQLAANNNTFATATTLGRGFSGGPFRAINIVEAGQVFIERLNQIDFRVAKLLRFGGTRTNVNFDFYNVTNSNAVIAENATFGAAWRTPQVILVPRLFKLSAQFDF